MKKIFYPLILLTVIIFLGDKIIFLCLNYVYRNTTVGQEGGELNNYLRNSKKIKLILLGSSTTKFQVDPNAFHVPSINLAHHSTTLMYSSAVLDILISKNKKPKAILLSVSPEYFTISPGVSPNQFQKEILFLKYYYNESQIVNSTTNNISRTERFKYLMWSYKFNGNVINNLRDFGFSIKKTNSTTPNFKYQKSSENDSQKVVILKNDLEKKNILEVRGLNTLPAISLINMIEVCKKNNIKLLCYYMPNLLDNQKVISSGVKFADSILTHHNIPYFKITNVNAPMLFKNESYWVDLQHLNEKGGKIETQLLVKFVKDSLLLGYK